MSPDYSISCLFLLLYIRDFLVLIFSYFIFLIELDFLIKIILSFIYYLLNGDIINPGTSWGGTGDEEEECQKIILIRKHYFVAEIYTGTLGVLSFEFFLQFPDLNALIAISLALYAWKL